MLNDLRRQPTYRNVEFLRFNFDTEDAFKRAFNVPVRSVIILFRNGREVDRITSNGDRAVIEALMRKAV